MKIVIVPQPGRLLSKMLEFQVCHFACYFVDSGYKQSSRVEKRNLGLKDKFVFGFLNQRFSVRVSRLV